MKQEIGKIAVSKEIAVSEQGAESEKVARRSNPRGAVIAGLAVVGLFFGGFGVWAAVAPLARGAYAPGTVMVEGKRKTVQHLEGGIVKEILVREGDRVRAGQVLVRLDPTQAQANFEIFLARRDRALGRLARLQAERDGAAKITFPKALTARAEEPGVAEVIADQRALFRARKIEVDSQIEILSQRVKQLKRQIEGMEAERKANREQVALIKDELEGVRALHKKGYAPLTRLRALERAAAALEGEFGERTAQIARAEIAIGETELEIIQVRQRFNRAVLDDLRETRASVADLNEQLRSARDIFQRGDIRAPIAGLVVGLGVHTIGGVVRAGQPILDIVPENDQLMIEARVRVTDGELVHEGLNARIRFPGLPRRTAPLIHGTVRTVSGDAIDDPQTRSKYYLAQIDIPDSEMAKFETIALVPGMPADVLISTGKRTVLGYLVAPWTDLFEKAMRED